MNTDEAAACSYGGDGATDDWAAAEARFHRAKQALLEARQRRCDAAREFLLARDRVRQMLEVVFPGMEADFIPPSSEARCGCDRAAA